MITCSIVDSVEFGEYEKKTINMVISSKYIGYLRVVGIAGKVSSTLDKIQIWGKVNFDKISIKLEPNQVKQDYDRKLEIEILPAVSALQVKFTEVPKEVLAGEIFPVSIELFNAGPNDIVDVYISNNSPRELVIEPKTIHEMPLSIMKGLFLESSHCFEIQFHFVYRSSRYFYGNIQQRQGSKKAIRDENI